MTSATPGSIYVWLVPSEEVLDQPGSWRIRKWDTEPFPEANFVASKSDKGQENGPSVRSETACKECDSKQAEIERLREGWINADKIALEGRIADAAEQAKAIAIESDKGRENGPSLPSARSLTELAQRTKVEELIDHVRYNVAGPDRAMIEVDRARLEQVLAGMLVAARSSTARTALEDFNEHTTGGSDDMTPLERLRFFCSFGLEGQDWLDVEPFFDAVEKQLSTVSATALTMPKTDEILLACGEMKASELRTVQAALRWFIGRVNGLDSRTDKVTKEK